MDLKSGDFTGGAPEDTLMGAAVGDVGAFYGLPTMCGVNASGAKLPGWQSAVDDVTTTFLSMLTGVDMLTGVGMVAGGRIFSYEELILGAEVAALARAAAGAAAARRPATAPATDLAALAAQAAELLPRDGAAARARARDKALELLATHEPPPLPPDVDAELRRLVDG